MLWRRWLWEESLLTIRRREEKRDASLKSSLWWMFMIPLPLSSSLHLRLHTSSYFLCSSYHLLLHLHQQTDGWGRDRNDGETTLSVHLYHSLPPVDTLNSSTRRFPLHLLNYFLFLVYHSNPWIINFKRGKGICFASFSFNCLLPVR